VHVQALGTAVVIVVGPTLLPHDVDELARKLDLLRPVELLTIDLASVRSLDDCVFARLAEAARRITPAVMYRGLSRHHQRLLRYLGHGVSEAPSLAVVT
jgi:hypothetical protein